MVRWDELGHAEHHFHMTHALHAHVPAQPVSLRTRKLKRTGALGAARYQDTHSSIGISIDCAEMNSSAKCKLLCSDNCKQERNRLGLCPCPLYMQLV